MATDAVRIDVPQPESVEQLAREAEQLKNKLAEEKAKLNDVDCKYGVLLSVPCILEIILCNGKNR